MLNGQRGLQQDSLPPTHPARTHALLPPPHTLTTTRCRSGRARGCLRGGACGSEHGWADQQPPAVAAVGQRAAGDPQGEWIRLGGWWERLGGWGSMCDACVGGRRGVDRRRHAGARVAPPSPPSPPHNHPPPHTLGARRRVACCRQARLCLRWCWATGAACLCQRPPPRRYCPLASDHTPHSPPQPDTLVHVLSRALRRTAPPSTHTPLCPSTPYKSLCPTPVMGGGGGGEGGKARGSKQQQQQGGGGGERSGGNTEGGRGRERRCVCVGGGGGGARTTRTAAQGVGGTGGERGSSSRSVHRQCGGLCKCGCD